MCIRDAFFALTEDINIYANLYKCNEGSVAWNQGSICRVRDGEPSGAGLVSVLLFLDLEMSQAFKKHLLNYL